MLPRGLSSHVQLCSIEAVVGYIVGTINMFIKQSPLLAKLQRIMTECKTVRFIFPLWFCKSVFWQLLSHLLLSSQSLTFPCMSKHCVVSSNALGTSQCHTSLSLPSFPQHRSYSDLHLSITFGKLVSLGVCIVSTF